MNKIKLNFLIKNIFLVCCIFISTLTLAQGNSDYKLGSGDTIKITVFGQEDLSIETLLNDSGKIDYPFFGKIKKLDKVKK